MKLFTISLALLLPAGMLSAPAGAQDAIPTARYSVELEGGATWQARNVARIPGDGGTYFSLRPLTGSGPDAFWRVTIIGRVRARQEVRAVWAPLRASGTGTLAQETRFDGQTFAAGVVTDGYYRFDSPRLTYRWRVTPPDARGAFWIGATALIRDAEVRLTQGPLSASDSNVGVVPLLHLAGDWPLAPRWRLLFDLDALAAPQGRAFDGGVRVARDVAPGWWASAGLRTLEGGADNDRVFNFAWFQFLSLGVGRRF